MSGAKTPAGIGAPVPGGDDPPRGACILAWADALAAHSEVADALTVTYGTPAHTATAASLLQWMREAGFDEAGLDPVGNVVGRYRAAAAGAPQLLTGSHYDTVRDGGRYDGRLGVLAPIAVVAGLAAQGRRLGFDLVVIGFADEEGVRFGTTFLGSSAVTGAFDPAVLERRDADGVTMREAMRAAGLRPDAIGQAVLTDRPTLGFVEVHIEQGPVLLDEGLALGVVTAINGGVRMLIEFDGEAGHAGTTPMAGRRDAACAAAEAALLVEARCSREPELVGTVGQLSVPGGSVNVIPGRAAMSLDVRAPRDAQRDAALSDILEGMDALCRRRGIAWRGEEIMRVPATPSDPRLAAHWREAVTAIGLPLRELPSGAGHDAMCMARACPQAMLFVRCGAGGISHSPRETLAAADAEAAVRAFDVFLDRLDRDTRPT